MVPFMIEEPSLTHLCMSAGPSLSEDSQSTDCFDGDYQDMNEVNTTNENKAHNVTLDAKKSKRITFCEFSALKYIPNLDHYSEQEKEAMYLTKEDKKRIRQEINSTLTEMEHGDLPDTEFWCFRGLESRGIALLYNQSKAIREIALSLVLEEQEEWGEICPDWIEHVYCRITENSAAKAIKIARWDAQCGAKDLSAMYSGF